MRHRFLFLLLALGLVVSVHAQPVALSVNPASREEVRQFYRAVYQASEGIPMAWTGNYATGAAGDTSAAFKEATRLRINFYRALVGVPAGVTFNATFSTKAQQAALMMSANQALSHFPPTSWTFYTAAGAEAAANSNLAFGNAGPGAVDGFMSDEGQSNAAAGHRRWLIYPQTREMGTGDVPGNATTFSPANAIWVFDSQVNAPRPITRTIAVPYPSAGYIPYSLVWPRWSFTHTGADFSNASVSMTRGGQPVPVAIEPVSTGAGEPTLVWVYDNQNSNTATSHAKPAADTTYNVTVSNVRIGGIPQNFSYQVTVFDPDVASVDATQATLTGPLTPTVGAANSYIVNKPSFAAGIDWRTLQLSSFAKTYNAESGLDGLIASTNAGYNVVQTVQRASGSAAYQLSHPAPRADQTLLLPETFYVSNASAAVTFSSRLGLATGIQVARVQVSADDGVSWSDVFAQAGTSSGFPSEGAFAARSASLAAHVGRTLRVRFAYTVSTTGSAFPQTDPSVVAGWFIDNIALSNVQTVTAGSATRVASGNTFAFSPSSAGTFILQARGVLFGAFPLEWGPLAEVTATTGTGPVDNSGRLINLSILTTVASVGDNFTLGYVVGGLSGGAAKPLVIRAAGPSLGALGVPNTLDDPRLELFAGIAKTGENDNWGGSATIRDAMAAVGAFGYVNATSRDAASVASVTTRDNSVKVSAAGNGTGTVIAEIYDATPRTSFTAATPRLINVSVLKQIGSGMTMGFVIDGGAKTVLIRAIGPTLDTFQISNFVSDPQLTLFGPTSNRIDSNDNWGGTPALNAAFTAVGAFSLAPGSRDAAIVANLQPGNYTVEVTGVNNATGTALVEVYDVP